jgi:[amino group carrier protein]-lysine/ornithine hydrolase
VDELGFLARLVRRYSPSGSEGAAAREFVRIARELGYGARVDPVGNGIARRGRGHPRVVFLGHIDTVEGRLPVVQKAGRLHGRGTVDAKGPLVAALLAGREMQGAGEYVVVAAVGEEADSRGARYLLKRLRPDAVIAGEPSGWEGVTIGYKGELQVEQSFRGERTHFSSPFPTTADRALDWVTAVRAKVATFPKDSPFRSLTMKVVEFESLRRGDVESARVALDFRLPPGLSSSAVLQFLPSVPDSPAPRVLIRVEPIEVPRTNPVVLSLVEGVRAAGGRPTLWRKTGTSDLNLVLPIWKVPGAAYGPGEARLDHTDRESVSLEELRRSVTALRVAVGRLRADGGQLRGRSGATTRR